MNEGPRRRLMRSHDRKIAGVAGGIAEYFDLDPTVVRLLWVVAAIFSVGAAVLAYILFWIVMPEPPPESGGEPGGGQPGGPSSTGEDRSRMLLALVLLVAAFFIVAGAAVPFTVFTARVFMPDFIPGFFWPFTFALVLVLVILLLIRGSGRESR